MSLSISAHVIDLHPEKSGKASARNDTVPASAVAAGAALIRAATTYAIVTGLHPYVSKRLSASVGD